MNKKMLGFAIVALISATLFSLPASALIVRYIKCPRWGPGNPGPISSTPAAMVEGYLRSQFPASSVTVTSCKQMVAPTDYPNSYEYFCNANVCNSSGCGQSGGSTVGFRAESYGQYGPLNAEPGTSYYHCAIYSSTNDPLKNLGESSCRTCGKTHDKHPSNMRGNPINIGTGNKIQKEVDYPATDDGGLEYHRYYNSLNTTRSAAGAAWTHSWSRSIEMVASTEADAFRPDGNILRFVLVNGAWVGDPDNPETLTGSSSTGWILTTRNNEIERYDASGRLLTLTEANGRVLTLTYADGSNTWLYQNPNYPDSFVNTSSPATPLRPGMLVKVTDYRGRSLTFYYSIPTEDFPWKVQDPAGNVFLYSYDSTLKRLTSVRYPTNPFTSRTYSYDELTYTSNTDLPLALTGITDENGQRFATFTYDTTGRATSTYHAGNAENYSITTFGASSTTYTDPLGSTWVSQYSIIQGVDEVTQTQCSNCPGTPTESFTFDSNRNLLSAKDFNGNLSCFTNDSSRPNLEIARTEGLSGTGTCASRVTTPATRTITTIWHPTWRLPARSAEPLRIVTWNYNGDAGISCAPAGASTTLLCSKTIQATTDGDGSQGFSATADGAPQAWSYTYNASGQVLTIDGPRTDLVDVTTYSYYASDDAGGNYKAGDLASVTNAKNQVTQFVQYDASGRLKKVIDPNGRETLLAYSVRGWLTQRQVGNAASGYETTTYDYDSAGQLTKVTLPDSSYVSYTYDGAQRLTDIQDGLGNRIHYTLDAMGNRTQEDSYDPANNLARTHSRVIDALNRVAKEIGGTNPSTEIIQKGYDNNGNLTSIIDPLNRTTTQQYDALNRLIAVIDPLNGSLHPTTFQYNGRDALTQVTDPTGLTTSYSINGQGNSTAQSSPDTGSASFTYDAASNLKTRLDGRGIQATYSYDELNRITQISYPDQTVAYTYDSCTNGIGRVCSISDRSGTTAYTYDLWGRVTSKTQTVDTTNQTVSYTYNAAGQLSTLTLPSGHVVTYGYVNNQPVSIAVDGTTVLNSVVYEPFGPLAGWAWGNSAPGAANGFTRAIDKDYRITGVASNLPMSGMQALFDRQFSWDDQNRVTLITDLANSALSATYGYDALDRVTSASQGGSSWGYTYNGTGDRLTSTDATGTANYTSFAGSHQLQSITGTRSKSYAYDGAGNLSSDGTTTWTYGGDNRPTQVGSATVLINALGQRVKKVAASTTRFVYDEAGHLVGEYADDGSLLEETVWLGELPVATLRPNGAAVDTYYVQTDQLGTPRMVTRPSDNQIVWRWDNAEPFGNSSPNENPSGLGLFSYNFRFPGQYFDAETATNYNYFRDYDPSIGRYVESDPAGIWEDGSAYSYAALSPLSAIDFYGLAKIIPGGVRVPGTTASVRIDPPAPTHGEAQTHAHVCHKGCEIVVNKDGTGSHGTDPDQIKNKKVREFLRKKGINIREPGVGFFIGDIWDASRAFANYCLLPRKDQKCVDVGLSPGCGLFGGI